MDLEIDDEDAKYCSACLAVDVKLVFLQQPNLLEVFESIIRNTKINSQCIVQYVCCLCLELLKKCAQFHSMCCQAQQLLKALKPSCIATIRNNIIKQPVNLKISEVELTSYIPEDLDTEIAPDIKIEVPVEFHQELHNDDFDTHFDIASPESPVDIKEIDEKVQTAKPVQIKVIDDLALCESDLDQALVVSKTDLSRYKEKFGKYLEEFCKTHNVDVVFLTKEQQIENMKAKYKYTKYKRRCELCFAGFRSDTDYENHVKCHDRSSGSFVCEVCQLRYKDKKKWQRHVMAHERKFICKLCSKTLTSNQQAIVHHRSHEGNKHEYKDKKDKVKKYFEEFCKAHNVDAVFLTKEQQIERMKEKCQGNKYEILCELCFAGFMTNTDYEKHVKLHDPSSGSFVCEVCQLRYKVQRALQAHVKRHNRELICKLCSKTLASSQMAIAHHRWHEGVKHECKFCKKKFDVLRQLCIHVRRAHTQLRCSECGDAFQGSVRLKRHQDLAHGPVPESPWYKCDACPAKFSSDIARGAHWASIHGRPGDTHCATDTEDGRVDIKTGSYLCELCAKSFPTLTQLKRHHNNVHIFKHKCHLCTKVFSNKNTLQMHINSHTGDRPYQCKQCPERFKTYSQRYKHRLLVHEKDRPYKCSQCPKDYVLLYDLKAHIRYAHLHHPRPSRKNPRRKPNKIVQKGI